MIKNNKFKKYVAIWLLASIILSFISPSKVKANSLSAKIINITGNYMGYKDIGYTLATVAISTNGALYKYWLNNKDTDEWKLLRDYSELGSYTWKPEKIGNYRLVVHVKDKNSTKKYDDYGYKDIIVKGNDNITQLECQRTINKKMKYRDEIWTDYPNSNYGNYPETIQYEKDGFKGTLHAKRIKLVPVGGPKDQWVKGRLIVLIIGANILNLIQKLFSQAQLKVSIRIKKQGKQYLIKYQSQAVHIKQEKVG